MSKKEIRDAKHNRFVKKSVELRCKEWAEALITDNVLCHVRQAVCFYEDCARRYYGIDPDVIEKIYPKIYSVRKFFPFKFEYHHWKFLLEPEKQVVWTMVMVHAKELDIPKECLEIILQYLV